MGRVSSPADHQRGKLGLVGGVGVHLTHHAAMAQDKAAVGDGHHLMQLVADEDDRQAKGGGLAQGGEQSLGFLRGQDGGGFIKDQDLRIAVERLEDLDPLAFAHGQAADLGHGVDGKAEVAGQGFDLCPRSRTPASA